MKVASSTFESSVAGLGGCPFTRLLAAMCAPKTLCICCNGWTRNDIQLDNLIETANNVAHFFDMT